ncbi:hypothetical protein CEXT_51371, partial [Caerostris extrusa]
TEDNSLFPSPKSDGLDEKKNFCKWTKGLLPIRATRACFSITRKRTSILLSRVFLLLLRSMNRYYVTTGPVEEAVEEKALRSLEKHLLEIGNTNWKHYNTNKNRKLNTQAGPIQRIQNIKERFDFPATVEMFFNQLETRNRIHKRKQMRQDICYPGTVVLVFVWYHVADMFWQRCSAAY